MLAVKFFSSSTRWRPQNSLVTKPYDVQTQQLLEEKDELGHTSPIHNMLCEKLLHWGASAMTAPKNNPYICLELWEKKAQTSIHGLDKNQNWKTDFLKSQ